MHLSEEYELDIDEIEHFKNVMKKLNLMRKEQENCDLIINVEEKAIHVNKDVVCAASGYFDAMFSHDTIERQKGVVNMAGAQYCAVEKCIDFIYTGKLSVSLDQCDEILYSANLMQLHQVCYKIEVFLQSHLVTSTYFRIRRMAVKFSMDPLKTFCDKFAISNIASLSRIDEFNDIDVSFLKCLVSADKPCSGSSRMEDLKLGVTIQWIKAGQEDRMAHLIDIISLIDFSKLTLEYCKYLVDEEPLCRTSNDLVRMLLSAVLQNQDVPSHGLPGPEEYSDSTPSHNALIIFNDEKENVLAYFPSHATSRNLATYHDAIKSGFDSDFVACTTVNHVFIFLSNRKVYYFEIDSPQWQAAPEMLYSHGDLLRCAIHNGHAYVGGKGHLEKWDLCKESEWENVDLDGNICDKTAIIEFQRSLYLIGGEDVFGNAVTDVVKKHPHTRWTAISSMNTARKDARVVVYEENIYVTTCEDDYSSRCKFEKYDSVTRLWTDLVNIELICDHFILQLVDDQLVAVQENSIISYDPKEKCWSEVQNCPSRNMWMWATTTASISK